MAALRATAAAAARAVSARALGPRAVAHARTGYATHASRTAFGPFTQSTSANTAGSLTRYLLGASLATAAAAAGVAYIAPEARSQENSTAQTAAKPLFDKKDTTVVFVLGGPGAGKGTQCARIVRDYGFIHLSAGDLLRAERERPGSEYGELINNYIKEGKIVPMEITINLLKNAMVQSGGHRFLIDGFPRQMDQALKFEETVCECAFVLYFECPEAEMERRLLKRGETSGRIDDNIESIRKRFKTFVETSLPVIEYYEQQGKVKTLSCLNSIEGVYAEVSRLFGPTVS